MKNIIELDIERGWSVSTTDECKKLLNKYVGEAKWKRLYKYGEVRCFTNENGLFVTITENETGSPCAFVGINIQEEIKAIINIAKFYYTHDYGETWYRPSDKRLHISGGDGGFGYSDTKPKKDKWGDVDWDSIAGPGGSGYIEFNEHPETKFIKNVDWEAECGPNEEGYMRITTINDVCE